MSKDDACTNSQRFNVSSEGERVGQSQITTDGDGGQRRTMGDALAFLSAVREVFQDKSENYNDFLKIMRDFNAQRFDILDLTARVKELFKGHKDLILGFNTFLPKEFEMMGHEEEFTHFFPHTLGTASTHAAGSSVMPTVRLMHVEKRGRTIASHHDHHLSADHPDPELDKCLIKADTDQRRCGAKKKNSREERDKRQQQRYDKDYEHDGSREHLSHKWKSGCSNEDSGAESLHDTNESFGKHPLSSAYKDRSSLESRCSVVFGYIKNVKDKLQNSDDFQEFLKSLLSHRKELITRQELQLLMSNLLGKYADLIEGFDEFMAQREKNGHEPKPVKVENIDQDMDEDMEKRDPTYQERDESNATANKDVSVPKIARYASKDKYAMKPINELDLSNCEKCTPSYRLLPKDYPIQISRHRSELDKEVLNDHWVSVPSGNENSTFKHRSKNQYEESMFRCEDERYELDMLLNTVEATIKRVEGFLEKINANIIEGDSKVRIEDHLTAMNFRLIEQLYGDHGLDIVDELKKNALLVLPVIFPRLKQKQDEWIRCRADLNKIWSEVQLKNYRKSLDHHSYLKQRDKND